MWVIEGDSISFSVTVPYQSLSTYEVAQIGGGGGQGGARVLGGRGGLGGGGRGGLSEGGGS